MNRPDSLADTTLHAFALLFTGDAGLWHIVWVSLATSAAALLLAAPVAVLLAYVVALHRFRGRRILIWLAQTALALPAILIGLLLYLLLSPGNLLGDLAWLFSQPGIVAGQCLVALPLLFALSLAALQGVDPRFPETALALGASHWQVMLRVLHEARFGVMAALLSGFGRVFAEAGCALVVGGNIAGRTQTLSTAIVLESGRGAVAEGIALGIVLVLLALLLTGAIMRLQGNARVLRERA